MNSLPQLPPAMVAIGIIAAVLLAVRLADYIADRIIPRLRTWLANRRDSAELARLASQPLPPPPRITSPLERLGQVQDRRFRSTPPNNAA